jgi:hypothetical protein
MLRELNNMLLHYIQFWISKWRRSILLWNQQHILHSFKSRKVAWASPQVAVTPREGYLPSIEIIFTWWTCNTSFRYKWKNLVTDNLEHKGDRHSHSSTCINNYCRWGSSEKPTVTCERWLDYLLYSYFRVISRRLKLMCRRFGTPCSIFMGSVSRLFPLTAPMKMEQSVPKRRHIKFRRLGITQKK